VVDARRGAALLQTFSWLSKYKASCSMMAESTHKLFLSRMVDLHNEERQRRRASSRVRGAVTRR
jgi:hypothetical protein